jgi:hypothetical protein
MQNLEYHSLKKGNSLNASEMFYRVWKPPESSAAKNSPRPRFLLRLRHVSVDDRKNIKLIK